MIPAHHPSAGLLARYATGDLPLAPGLTVAAHLDACGPCAAQVEAIEAAEGRLMASLPDAPLRADALARTLRKLEVEGGETATDEVRLRVGDVDLPPALAAVGVGPRRWIGRGFWAARVKAPATEDWRLVLLRAPPGAKVPRHHHRAEELIAVLFGALRDDEAYSAGDFAEHRSGGEHDVQFTHGGPCACLIATQGRAAWPATAQPAAFWLGF